MLSAIHCSTSRGKDQEAEATWATLSEMLIDGRLPVRGSRGRCGAKCLFLRTRRSLRWKGPLSSAPAVPLRPLAIPAAGLREPEC